MSRNDFESNYLAHHGILGMKWGIRRYQNADGSLTEAGRKHYGVEGSRSAKQLQNRLNDYELAVAKNKRAKRHIEGVSNLGEKRARHEQNIKDGEKEISNLLKEAQRKGYTVNSKELHKIVNDNEDRVENVLYALMPFWNVTLSAANFLQKRTINRDDYEQAYKKHKVTDTKTAELEENYKAAKKKMKEYDGRENFNSDNWNEDDSYKLWEKYRDSKSALDDRKRETNQDKKSFKEKFAEANQRARERTSINAAVERGLAENKAKKEATNNSSKLSDKTIKSRVEYARKTGKFDMEFLERMDRYVDEENHSKAEVLKGYEKYLKEHGDEFYKKK